MSVAAREPGDLADVCLILEGAYPYTLGGVASWTHALIEAAPHLSFHVAALTPDARPRKLAFAPPRNVLGVTQISLSDLRPGRRPSLGARGYAAPFAQALAALVQSGGLAHLAALQEILARTGFGERALLDSRDAWRAMLQACGSLNPDAPLVDFFWTWRVLGRSVGALLTAPLPRARMYHAISTGYAGLCGARAKLATGRPLVITEHGIYTNERRIELALADWLYSSGRGGYSSDDAFPELRDLWRQAFSSMAQAAYAASDLVTTLYEGNQAFQRADGADDLRLRVIPNGVDFAALSAIPRCPKPRKPTVALIGRVVPIKDIRTFIFACAALKRRIGDFEAVILGPEDEDQAYADECRALVAREGLGDVVKFMGRVNIKEWLGRIDVIALTSISEAQPLVLLEAGAAGVPAVATDVGACREMLEGAPGDTDGAGGFIVRVGDSAGAADGFARLLSDAALRARMGEALKRRVQKRYNRVDIDAIYNQLYADMIAKPDAGQAAARAA